MQKQQCGFFIIAFCINIQKVFFSYTKILNKVFERKIHPHDGKIPLLKYSSPLTPNALNFFNH